MHIILYLLQVELIRKMCVIMVYWMMKSKRWNIDQLYHLSKLLENKMKKIWRGEKIVKLSWQARDCDDDVLKVTALCCSIIIYSFFCSQSIYLNLCTRDRAGASERMQSEQIGERGKSSF